MPMTDALEKSRCLPYCEASNQQKSMFRSPYDYLSVSPEYNEFIEEYHIFLKYSMEASRLCVLINTFSGGETTNFFYSCKRQKLIYLL
jgi:hypothetical protein